MDIKIIWLYRSLEAIVAKSQNRQLVLVVDTIDHPTHLARLF